jgi:hypothetical protein
METLRNLISGLLFLANLTSFGQFAIIHIAEHIGKHMLLHIFKEEMEYAGCITNTF